MRRILLFRTRARFLHILTFCRPIPSQDLGSIEVSVYPHHKSISYTPLPLPRKLSCHSFHSPDWNLNHQGCLSLLNSRLCTSPKSTSSPSCSSATIAHTQTPKSSFKMPSPTRHTPTPTSNPPPKHLAKASNSNSTGRKAMFLRCSRPTVSTRQPLLSALYGLGVWSPPLTQGTPKRN